MGKNDFKRVDAGGLAAHLRHGRHVCNCQARVHSLVRNCIGCGRIVCAQEGSGRCFYCGRLVCTRDERTMIERKDEQSLLLLRRLLDDPHVAKVDLEALRTPSAAFSLSEIGKSIETANAYKQKLLKADKDQKVTRVNDLQADYFSLEHNPYLTAAEREAIVKRKEELRQLSSNTKRNILVDLDLSTGTMREQKKKTIETVADPILQSILVNSAARNLHQNLADINEPNEEKPSLIDTFLPKYDDKSDVGELRKVAEQLEGDKLSQRSPQKLFCVALKQPFIGRLLALALPGKNSIHAIPWLQSVQHRGTILIAALGDDAPIEFFNGGNTQDEEKRTEDDNNSYRQSNVILAKGTLFDCITFAEFNREYSELPLFHPFQDAFFLLFTDIEVSRALVNAVNLALVNGGEIYEDASTF